MSSVTGSMLFLSCLILPAWLTYQVASIGGALISLEGLHNLVYAA